MNAPGTMARRDFLSVVAFAGSGLVLGVHVPTRRRDGAPDAPGAEFAPNAFVRVATDGTVTVVIGYSEMGQGILTALPMLVAEELEVDPATIRFEQGPAADEYKNPLFGLQATGGSSTVRGMWEPMRRAGAAAREMLLAAAAARWSVPRSDLVAANGTVTHGSSGRRASYGSLTQAASKQTVPTDVALKPASAWKVLGRRMKRLDSLPKVTGRAQFGLDVRVPGMLVAVVARCPVFGGRATHFEATAARAVPGVRHVVASPSGVAVVADGYWAALKGREALSVTWDEGATAAQSSDAIRARWVQLAQQPGITARHEGQGADALAAAARRLDAVYEAPYLAHATMEPMNCTVHVTPASCEVWVGIQVMTRAQKTAADVTGLALDKVIVHQHLLGGGFGRRLEYDMVTSAVRIGQKVDGPVKVIWSREEDMQHGLYRPAWHDRFSAHLSNGKIDGWKHIITGSSVLSRWLPPAAAGGKDFDAWDSAADLPYDIPNLHVAFVREEPQGLRTGFWRGVGPAHNVFVIESFIDELAHKAGKDPVDFRLAMLDKAPRLQAALRLAAEKSGWGQPLPPRCGRGVAVQPSFTSWIATVAEVEVDEDGEVLLRHVTCAVDTGIAVNPDTIAAQLQGGIIFGLTAALYGEVTVENGRVQQSNFNDYRMLRMDQTPPIDIYVIPSGEPPGGIGEAGTVAGMPALGNAIYAATGKRLRRLPIDRDVLAGRTKA